MQSSESVGFSAPAVKHGNAFVQSNSNDDHTIYGRDRAQPSTFLKTANPISGGLTSVSAISRKTP